jgi:hypothetical protein
MTLATLFAGSAFGLLILATRRVRFAAAAAQQTPLPTGSEYKAAAFPLKVSENRHYLEDGAGHPFLMTGDSPWSLIVEPKRDDVDLYLNSRRQQGFNTLLINLIEHKFSSNAPANAYGQQPFKGPGRFAEPNDLYFDNAEWVLKRALDHGFLVLLAPAYLGAGGGNEGWFAEMNAAGPEALHAYGRYLGARYRNLPNIVWVHGGDFDAPDKSLSRAVADGIAEADPNALHTAHPSRETATADFWRGERWLSIDTVYTYEDVFRAVSTQFDRKLPLPILLIETLYEGEHGTDEQRLRSQAYGAILGGAAGQIFGNNPVWHFSGPGLFFPDIASIFFGWRHALASPGASSMGRLRSFFEPLEWWKIEPDHGGILAGGQGYSICAAARDSSFVIVYVAGASELMLKPPWRALTEAHWYDPTAGTFRDAAAPTNGVGGQLVFKVPASSNANGFSDWLLLLKPRVDKA